MDIILPDKTLPDDVAAERVRCIKAALSAPMAMDGGTLYRMAWRDAAHAIALAILSGQEPAPPAEALDAFRAFRAKHPVS